MTGPDWSEARKMKTLIVLLFPVLTACAAGQAATQPAGQAAAKAPPAKAEPSKSLQIPAGAVETEPGLFRYTDSGGRKWLYRKTPFGVSRWEDKPAAAPTARPFEDNTKAFEEGDLIRFEHTTPLGVSKWVKKKSELDDQERSIWERDKAQAEKSKQDKK
jgi:hypothetical protein